MAEDVVGISLQTPQITLAMDSDTAHYVGILEGTIAALVINECKYRALLELLTGESWEGTRLDIKGDVLQQIAVSALIKQTGMASDRAKLLVAQRWDTRNQPQATMVPMAVPLTPTVPSADPSAQEASTPASEATGAPDMASKLSRWKTKQVEEAQALQTPEDNVSVVDTEPKPA